MQLERRHSTLIGDRLRSGARITEWEVTQFILQQFAASDLFTDHGPNCSVNENAANPHYEPTEVSHRDDQGR